MTLPRNVRGRIAPVLLSTFLVGLSVAPSHAQWTQTDGPRGGMIRSFVTVPDGAGGADLLVGQIRVWRTDDEGSSWAHLDEGLTDPNAFALLAPPDGSGDHDLLVGTNAGIFRSTDGGATWSAFGSGLTNPSIYALGSGPNGSGGTYLYAGAFLGNVYRSGDAGATWTPIDNGLPVGQANINAFVTTASGTVLVGTMNGIYRSTNFGASWTRVFTLYGFSFAKHGATLYAGSSNGVYQSVNDGATWTPINTGLGFSWIKAMAAIPGGPSGVTLFAGAGGVLRSTDNGASWVPVINGLTSMVVYALTTAPNSEGGIDLYAGTADGVFKSSNLGNSWTNVSFIYSRVQALDVTPSGTVVAGTEADIYRSTNLGGSWIDTNGSSIASALDFAVNPNGSSGVSLFAAGSPTGVAKSIDDGATWQWSSNGLDDVDANSVAAVPNNAGGTNILAGTYSELFISFNDGAHWTPANLQTLTLDYAVTPNGGSGHNIFAAGFGGVWRSTNGGTAWTDVSGALGGQIVQAMAATSDGDLFAGGDPFGIYRSTDDGATWEPVNGGLTDLRITSLVSSDGTTLFAAGAGGVFRSNDGGESWASAGTGLPTGVMSLAVSADGATLLAGTSAFGVWTLPLSGTVAVGDEIPNGLSLGASLPNPFRTETTLRYAIPRRAAVRLAIYDITGRAVRTLVDRVEEAGPQQAIWDGRDAHGALAGAGLYLCTLEVEGSSVTRKLTLTR